MKSKVLMKDLPSNCKIALHIVPGPSDTWMIKRMRMEDYGCTPPQTRLYQIYQDISRLAVVQLSIPTLMYNFNYVETSHLYCLFRFLGNDPPTTRTCIWTSPEARKDDCNLFDRSLVTLVAMSFSSESESSS